MLRLILLVLALMATAPCTAAITSWEAFDFMNCKHWGMTPDDYVGNGYNYRLAQELAEALNQEANSRGWFVVQGGILYEKGEHLYGVCSAQDNRIECINDEDIDFPLSGATYQQIDSKITFQTYKCIRGCDTTEIKMIHDMGYDPEGENTEYVRLYKMFDRECHDKEKKLNFFQEYEKQMEKQQDNSRTRPSNLNQIIEFNLPPKSKY